MTSTPLIKRMRFSFIWSATFTQLFDSQDAKPLAFVGDQARYQKTFNELHNKQYKEGIKDEDNFGFPWEPGLIHKHHFWGHYLKDKEGDNLVVLARLKARRAWRQLLPFRSTLNLPRVETSKDWKIDVEAFYYSFGLALVINVECIGQFTIDKVINIALTLNNNQIFTIKPNVKCKSSAASDIYKKSSRKPLNLDKLAELCLNTIRKENLGLANFPENGNRASEPFRIFTPVQADNINPKENITKDSKIHQMLEAVTTGKDPRARDLPNLSKAIFNVDDHSLIYHRTRGRAVWFPIPLTYTPPAGQHIFKLRCYHRNLVLTSLQVESLCRLLTIAAKEKDSFMSKVTYSSLVRRAANNIRQLYGHRKATYTSPSVEIHIDDNGWEQDINNVCAYLNIEHPELHRQAWD